MDYDFSFFLLLATVATGLVWGGHRAYLRWRGLEFSEDEEPAAVEYARSFFPIVLIVLLLRSFIAEPFRIPSGSMMPTLLVGDFILVNKFIYGIRLPVANTKVVALGQPQRGDIVVFRFPKDPTVDYIKRVVGLPGDEVVYRDKRLTINGRPAVQTSLGVFQGVGQGEEMTGAERLAVDLGGGVRHEILVRPQALSAEGTYTVPEGHYFVMGDNRDNSNDSRYWGFVPERNLVGKAFFIWMNWDWQHGGVDFGRLGTVLN